MEQNWRISDSEWLIMRCLWKQSPLKLRDLQAMLKEAQR